MEITDETVDISLDTVVGTSGDGKPCSEGPKTVKGILRTDTVSNLPEFTAEDATVIAATANMVPQMFGHNGDYPAVRLATIFLRCRLNGIWHFRLTIKI
jgi:hypothetical protein